MSEQVVQTYITWTHGAQPTWLQFHGPGALLDRPIRLTTSPPPPPSLPLLLPSKSQRTRRSIYSTDPSRDEEPRSPGRSSKRSRTALASAPRRSRRPFTVFSSKRAGRPSRSPSATCKHYCHAILRHGRKCLSPCARRRPGHYHCRCARHQRQ